MQTGQTRAFLFEDVELDVRRRSVSKAGQPVSLNAKAFDLLLFFAENAGRVVTKDEILETVWKEQFVEESNLTVQISAIRKALGDSASDPRFLATIPGRGYQFVADVKTSDDEAKEHSPSQETSEAKATNEFPTATKVSEGDPNGTGSATTLGRRWLIAGGFAIVVLAIGLIAAYRWGMSDPRNGVNALAVIPFTNQTGSSESDIISDGLAESVIFTVSRLPNIKVMSSASSFRYRENQHDAVQIGKALGVDAIITGRLTRNDEKVVVRTEMVSARDNSVMWGEVFIRDRDDIEKLQTDIASAIGRSLAISLRNEQTDFANKMMTDDPDAYQLYLAGRQHLNRLTDDGFHKARESFQAAIAKDPNYALAYAGLAEAYILLSGWSALAPNDGFPHAKVAALRAIELDETLAEGHNQLATVKLFYDLDREGAERELLSAIELNPSYSDAYQMYSYALILRGSFSEARDSAARSLELDPLSILKRITLGNSFYFERNFNAAIEQYLKALEIDSNSGLAYWSLGNAHIGLGNYDEAISLLENAIKFSGDSPDEPASLAVAKALKGDKETARRIAKELEKRAEDHHVPATMFVMIYGALDERDTAFEYLEKAIRERDSNLLFLEIDTLFDSIRDDARFDAMLSRIINLS